MKELEEEDNNTVPKGTAAPLKSLNVMLPFKKSFINSETEFCLSLGET